MVSRVGRLIEDTGNRIKGYDPEKTYPYDALIKKASEKYGIPYETFRKQLFQESRFDPNAKSKAGAIGIGQIMPGTARRYFGVKDTEDLYNPILNIDLAAKILARNIADCGGDLNRALALYNGGSKASRYYARGEYDKMPKETRDYVNKLGDQYKFKPYPTEERNTLLSNLPQIARSNGWVPPSESEYSEYENLVTDGYLDKKYHRKPIEEQRPVQVAQQTQSSFLKDTLDTLGGTKDKVEDGVGNLKAEVADAYAYPSNTVSGSNSTIKEMLDSMRASGAEVYKEAQEAVTDPEFVKGVEDVLSGVEGTVSDVVKATSGVLNLASDTITNNLNEYSVNRLEEGKQALYEMNNPEVSEVEQEDDVSSDSGFSTLVASAFNDKGEQEKPTKDTEEEPDLGTTFGITATPVEEGSTTKVTEKEPETLPDDEPTEEPVANTPFIAYTQRSAGRDTTIMTTDLDEYYANQKAFFEEQDADSEVGLVGGAIHSALGTAIRVKGATTGFSNGVEPLTFKLTPENVKTILDKCGGDMEMAEAALKYVRRPEDIPSVIKILEENRRYDQLSASASLTDNLMSGVGNMLGNPADIAMMFFGGGAVGTAFKTATGALTKAGIRQVGSAALGGGIGNVLSGEINQEYTGVKEDAGANLVSGALFAGGLVGAGKYLGDLSIRSRMLRQAQVSGKTLSPQAFDGLWGNNGLAEGINNIRKGIEAKLPSVTSAGALSWAKTDAMVKLRNKLFKVEEGVEVRKPDGSVEYRQVNVRGKTVEEQLRDRDDYTERVIQHLQDITDEIEKYGATQSDIDYAVERYIETGELPDTAYKDKIKMFGDTLMKSYEMYRKELVDRDLLPEGIDNYTPTVIDDMSREEFISKQNGGSYQERKINAIATIKKALLTSAKNPKVRERLNKQFTVEKLNPENEARRQRIEEATKEHDRELNKLNREYLTYVKKNKNSKNPEASKRIAKKKVYFNSKKKDLDNKLKAVVRANRPVTKAEEKAMFNRWVNTEAQNTALGWVDKNESVKVGLYEDDPSITPNFRKHRTAFGYTELAGTGFNPQELRVPMIEAFRLYSRRVGGDVIAYDSFGTKNFAETDALFGKILQGERNVSTSSPKAAKAHAKRVEEMQKALRHIQDRIYSRADPDSQRDLNFIDAMADVLRNFTFATSNAYMGLLNYTEVAEGVKAYGASFVLHSIPVAGQMLERFANKASTLEDRDTVMDILFTKEIKNRRIFRDLKGRHRARYRNNFLANIVAGSEWIANNSPMTRFLEATQISIVDCVRGKMLADLVRDAHTPIDLRSKKGIISDKALRRNRIMWSDMQHLYNSLRDSFDITPDGIKMNANAKKALLNDPLSMHVLRRLGDYAADETILRPGLGDDFFRWHNSQIGKLLLQFKSFAIRSYNKRLVKSFNRAEEGNAMSEMYSFAISQALATLGTIGITEIRTLGMSEEDKKKVYQNTFGVDGAKDFLSIGGAASAIANSSLRSSPLAMLSLVLNTFGIGTSAKTTADLNRIISDDQYFKIGKVTSGDLISMLPALNKGLGILGAGTNGVNYLSSVLSDGASLSDQIREKNALYRSLNAIMPNIPGAKTLLQQEKQVFNE